MAFIHVPIIALYIGFLPFSVNGQCVDFCVLCLQRFYNLVLQMVVMCYHWDGVPVVGTHPQTRLVQESIIVLPSDPSVKR